LTRSSVQLAGVSKQFGPTSVIREVSLAVEPGEFVVFVGPSGCGKSTLLRLIAGLEEPSAGSIRISGRDVTHTHPSKRGVAMVFQSYALYPHMSVAANMAFGLRIQGSPKTEIDARVRKAAEILQLQALLERKPRALSGGQRQRVAIGRAIVREPDVFLFDEPLSNLDAALRGQMRVEIARLHARLGTTMIYVTHDQIEAMTLASRIVVLNAGRIEQIGAPLDLYHRPANRFVAGFLGSPRMNFLAGRIASADEHSVAVDVAGERTRLSRPDARVAVGDPVTLGVRPEDLGLADTGNVALRGEVSLLERLGGEALLHVRLSGGPTETASETVIAKVAGDAALTAGQPVALRMNASACHLFDAAGGALGSPDAQAAVQGAAERSHRPVAAGVPPL
jgi:multiple sugar transport system ATP-binding protein